jgi:hypothetical protein
MYAAELKRIYDKAYAHRASIIRQEDLLQRFLMGLEHFWGFPGSLVSTIEQDLVILSTFINTKPIA